MIDRGIDRSWLAERVRENSARPVDVSDAVERLREELVRWAVGFAARRADVASSAVSWPRRGLLPDEAGSFLRAVEHGIAVVDEAGCVILPTIRAKTPSGRYALLSRSGTGVSVNLEYLIQVGATAELVLDHGWRPDAVDFERGEFDALARDEAGRVVLAMEAKARVTGPDSLEKLVESWLQASEAPDTDLATNAGRKFRELSRLTNDEPVLVWLVADGARWSLWAHQRGGGISFTPAASASRAAVLGALPEGAPMLETHPFDASLHRPGTAAHDGGCSWHGPVSCPQPPVISFRDAQGSWQSGCARAVRELAARGQIASPTDPGDDHR